MASRHPSNIYNAEHDTNQAQDQSGAQAKNVAQNAVDMAEGAAVGAASMAQGAAEVVKNTLGMNATSDATNAAARSGGSSSPRNNGHPSSPATKMKKQL